jgi:hypothetical protein
VNLFQPIKSHEVNVIFKAFSTNEPIFNILISHNQITMESTVPGTGKRLEHRHDASETSSLVP